MVCSAEVLGGAVWRDSDPFMAASSLVPILCHHGKRFVQLSDKKKELNPMPGQLLLLR
jgi:hypothetical protein